MNVRTIGWTAALGMVLGAASAQAQAWNYPSFHQPQIARREYNFGLAAGGDAGTSLIGQWREGIASATELNLEIGVALPDEDETGLDNRFMVGIGLAQRVMQANQEFPLDMVLTGGVYPSFGDPSTFIRIPVGVSLGRRVPFAGSNIALTPYVHPRLSIDICSDDDVCDETTDVGLNFDLGGNLELNRQLSMRFAILFGAGEFPLDETGFGFALAWKPRAVSR
jgi:hypothetical protein